MQHAAYLSLRVRALMHLIFSESAMHTASRILKALLLCAVMTATARWYAGAQIRARNGQTLLALISADVAGCHSTVHFVVQLSTKNFAEFRQCGTAQCGAAN